MPSTNRIFRLLLVFGLMAVGSSPVPAQLPADIGLQPFVTGLDAAVGVKAAPDGSGRLFVVEQGGRVIVVDSDGTRNTEPFIDISSRVSFGGERGLLDLAFHPQYAVNGRFLLHYSAGGASLPPGTFAGDSVVAEFQVDPANPDRALPDPLRIVLTVRQDFANHNGGQIEFGPEGYLYVALGDGGSGNDPCNRAQTLDPAGLLDPGQSGCPSNAAAADPSRALLGKILRIDVDASTPAGANNLCGANLDGSAGYAIPTENPFAGTVDRCGEVLLYGLRNPWRFGFDRATGDLWIGDVGQNVWEEIDRVPWPLTGGDNLGWKPCEGRFARGSTTAPCALLDSLAPVLDYQHASGRCSVTGGYRYRGPVSSIAGRYLYGDFCTGELWFGREQGGGWTTDLFGPVGANIRSFGEDPAGNVYLVTGNALLRVIGEEILVDSFESPSAAVVANSRAVSTNPAQ